jgi:hypothetical protein
MARNFNGTSDVILGSSAPASVVPITIAAWVYATDLSNDCVVGSFYNEGNGSSAFIDYAQSTQRFRARVRTSGGIFSFASTTTGPAINTWHHVCSVFESNASRSAYIDGGSKGINTTSRSLSAFDRVSMGARGITGGATTFFPGYIAEFAAWNIALTDDDVASLAKGFSPRLVRPQSLVFYAPLIRNVQDLRGVVALTTTGTTVADHPRIYT